MTLNCWLSLPLCIIIFHCGQTRRLDINRDVYLVVELWMCLRCNRSSIFTVNKLTVRSERTSTSHKASRGTQHIDFSCEPPLLKKVCPSVRPWVSGSVQRLFLVDQKWAQNVISDKSMCLGPPAFPASNVLSMSLTLINTGLKMFKAARRGASEAPP